MCGNDVCLNEFSEECGCEISSNEIWFMKILWSLMLVVILGLQYRLWVGSGSFAEVWRLQQKVESQAAINQSLSERNSRLNAEVLDLKRGFDAIEERARFNLGMIASNETFFMVVTSK